FKFLGQIDEHADGGDGVLEHPLLVPHANGKTQAADADFIDAQFPVVALALLVVQLAGTRRCDSSGLDPAAARRKTAPPVSILTWLKHSWKGSREEAVCKQANCALTCAAGGRTPRAWICARVLPVG